MNGTPASEGSMILVLLDKHGEPAILLGEQAGPGAAGIPSSGGKPEAGPSDNEQ